MCSIWTFDQEFFGCHVCAPFVRKLVIVVVRFIRHDATSIKVEAIDILWQRNKCLCRISLIHIQMSTGPDLKPCIGLAWVCGENGLCTFRLCTVEEDIIPLLATNTGGRCTAMDIKHRMFCSELIRVGADKNTWLVFVQC